MYATLAGRHCPATCHCRVVLLAQREGCPKLEQMTDSATATSVNAIGNKKVFDEGFDLDLAVYNLHAAAIHAGALPERDPQAASPAYTSMAHDHGNNLCECTKNPCRIQALCFALAEVVRYREESRVLAPFIDAADRTANMRRDLRKLVSRYAPVLDWFDQQSIEEHRLERDFGPRLQRHFHEVLCVLPKDIRESLGGLHVVLDQLEQLEGKLRGIPWSFSLQQPNRAKRAKLLLTAVYQHLRHGGLTYAEIAALVPDDLGTNNADERVRKRCMERNACSVLPMDMVGKIR